MLRAQVFAGDALSHVAFTGALAAAAAGLDLRIGLFAATIAIAVLLGRARRSRAGPTTSRSGSCSPGCSGSACSSWPSSAPARAAATALARRPHAVRLDLRAQRPADARSPRSSAPASSIVLLAVARPLLFATLDSGGGGRPRRPGRGLLGRGFLVLLGATPPRRPRRSAPCCCSACSRRPAGAAHRLTSNPYRGLGVSAAIAVLSTWAGLTLSYRDPRPAPELAIIGVAVGVYGLAFLATSDVSRAVIRAGGT